MKFGLNYAIYHMPNIDLRRVLKQNKQWTVGSDITCIAVSMQGSPYNWLPLLKSYKIEGLSNPSKDVLLNIIQNQKLELNNLQNNIIRLATALPLPLLLDSRLTHYLRNRQFLSHRNMKHER